MPLVKVKIKKISTSISTSTLRPQDCKTARLHDIYYLYAIVPVRRYAFMPLDMIETERLIIKPLTYEQLIKYARLDNSLETELNLNTSSRTISAELKEALEQTILPNVAAPNKNYLFSTLWTIISKADNKMVGDLCFVGEPNSDGEIEIGYGTYDEFRKRGFMTEAVGAMIGWVKKQPDIRTIIASTDKNNVDSFSILQKNSFTKSGETGTLFNWRLEILVV